MVDWNSTTESIAMGRTRPLACLTILGSLLLAACGGEDETETAAHTPGPALPPAKPPPYGGGQYPTFDAQSAALYRQGAEFTHADPNAAQENGLRAGFGQEALCAGSGNPDCASASAYGLQNLEFAHTAKLPDGRNVTGEGTLIAIVDNGYRTTHQELAGKEIVRFLGGAAALGVDSHGTAVASVAAGKADGRGMMGVAPGAGLHLSSWAIADDRDLPAHLAAATADAAAHGAVVQNNSWGWQAEKPADAEARDFALSGASDYAAYFAGRQGGSAAGWRTLFSTYDAFQKTGVLVFANSNDAELGDASAWSSLPNFVPQLAEAWIAVSNALFSVDGRTGAILEANLLSAPCGSAARFCLTADGTLVAPARSSDTAYQLGTGTSYAAPQVSGDVALLAQAFPNLAPAEWTSRLLATARRDWPDFQASIAGETRFAAGVRRAYSRLFGHGVPDMRAALSPVGGLSIASGRTVFDGEGTPLAEGLVGNGPIIGNAVARALAGRTVMVVDALGADFYVSGAVMSRANSKRAHPGMPGGARPGQRLDQAFAFTGSLPAEAGPLAETGIAKLLFSQAFAGLGAAPAFSRLMALGPDDYLQFSGAMERSDAMRFAAARLTAHAGFSSELTFSAGHDGSGGLFGSPTPGPLMAAEDSGYMATSLTLGAPFGADWSLAGFAELGVGYARAAPGALVDYGALSYGSAGVIVGKQAIAAPGDRASVYAGIRPAALAGKAQFLLPVGRDEKGVISYEVLDIDLARADLPLRFGLSYANRTSNDFDLRINANADLLLGDPQGYGLGLAVGLRKSF